jgi:hypothetical protein
LSEIVSIDFNELGYKHACGVRLQATNKMITQIVKQEESVFNMTSNLWLRYKIGRYNEEIDEDKIIQ